MNELAALLEQAANSLEQITSLHNSLEQRLERVDSLISNLESNKKKALEEEKEPLLNQRQAACILGVSSQTVSTARKRRQIKAVRVGDSWRYRKSDVLALKENRKNRK